VQVRIRQLVGDRITQAQDQIAELVAFTGQLQKAAARLGVHTPDGACDDDCGCRSEPDLTGSARREPITLLGVEHPEIACSLDPDSVGDRIDEWRETLESAKSRQSIPDGVRIVFDREVNVASLASLAAAEQTCCSFFRFDITIDGEVSMAITGPADAQPVIASVFGTAE
jgi:hypothetical protein